MRHAGQQASSHGGGAEHTLLYIVLFVVAMLISTSLLLIALLLYIAELVGSLPLSLLIVGGALLVTALAIYFGAVRPALREMRAQLQTIYEVSTALQRCYNWLITKLELLLNLL